jgi:CobW/HypB/UreG, nucleotide-binding domain
VPSLARSVGLGPVRSPFWRFDAGAVERDDLKVAVIVNDMSEVNVDAQLMKNGSASLSRVDERLVEVQNG